MPNFPIFGHIMRKLAFLDVDLQGGASFFPAAH
jgi:hypothetical protein